jgi:histidinol-phosphate aminotransferase
VPYKAASNEKPYPPLPGVLAAIEDAARGVNRYPDFGSTGLIGDIADYLGVDAAALAVGTGSVALLQHALQIACDDDDEVIAATPSFEAYPIVATVTGARLIQVPVTAEHRHDLAAMAAAVTQRTRVVIVCSPNNPTGTAVTRDEFEEFLRAVPSDVLVILDEAYVEFVDAGSRFDALVLLQQFPNVCVMRTFSKAFGLAGLRVGYAIADPTVAEALRAVATPFGVSAVAQAAARACLAPPARREIQQRVDHLVTERVRLHEALAQWSAPDPQGNFVWLPLAERSAEFAQACERQGLSVRLFDGVGVRVTVGEAPANDRVIAIAHEVL